MKLCISFLASMLALTGVTLAGDLAISTKGELMLEDALAKIDKPWTANKGDWAPCDGGVKGVERASDKHAAVIRRPLAFTDAVIEFSFRLDGAKGISFSVNAAKGHLCRLSISPESFQARKDDSDHAGPDKGIPFPAAKGSLADGKWHSALIELVGEQMVCQIDGAVSRGTAPALATPKANVGFTVSGQGACFKDLKVWKAVPKN